MKQVINRLKVNVPYIAIGLLTLLKGLAFFEAKRPPFYYPPSFKGIMNSPIFYGAFIVAGFLLIVYILSSYNNVKITGVLISIIAGLTAVLCMIELEHFLFLGDFGTQLACNLLNLYFILWIARHFSKR